MARRKHKPANELMAFVVVAGLLYLLLHAAGTSAEAAGYAAVGLAGVLVGASLRGWADRLSRRFGYRITKTRRGGRR